MQLEDRLDQCVFLLAGTHPGFNKIQLCLDFESTTAPGSRRCFMSVIAQCSLSPKQLLAKLKGDLYSEGCAPLTDAYMWLHLAHTHHQMIFMSPEKWGIEGMLFGVKNPEDDRTDEDIKEAYKDREPDALTKKLSAEKQLWLLKGELEQGRQLDIQERASVSNNDEVFSAMLEVGQACIDQAEAAGWSSDVLQKDKTKQGDKTKLRTEDLIFNTVDDFNQLISIMGNKEYDDFLEEQGLDARIVSQFLS